MNGKRIWALLLSIVMILGVAVNTYADDKIAITAPDRTEELDDSTNSVVIYSGAEEYRNAYFLERLTEQFPNYDISIEYMPTGNLAAKLAAEGPDTDIDII